MPPKQYVEISFWQIDPHRLFYGENILLCKMIFYHFFFVSSKALDTVTYASPNTILVTVIMVLSQIRLRLMQVED